mgnify:CR=1 FL=1
MAAPGDIAKSKTDERMLLLADSHSPEEISRDLGGLVSPARVASHVKGLLKNRDWLEEAEQDQIVTWKMRRLLRKLEEQYTDLNNVKVQLQLLKAIGERLDRRAALTEEQKSQLYANQAQIMFDAIRLAFSNALDELQARVPELTEEDARAALDRALPEAVYVISERNAGKEIEE